MSNLNIFGLKKYESRKEKIFIDLDGVIIDSHTAIVKSKETGIRVPLEECPPIEGALDALHLLSKTFNVYILSTARWSDPDNWGDRLKWIKLHKLEQLLFKKLILTHHKELLSGRALIDDRLANGAEDFQGEHIHFGTSKFPNWKKVVEYLMQPKLEFNLMQPKNQQASECVSCGEKTLNRYCSKKCFMDNGGLSRTNAFFDGLSGPHSQMRSQIPDIKFQNKF